MTNMLKQKFEIKVALIGNVSAGKTTILNSLLRDKYGEVSMRRTTAGINCFRISYATTENHQADEKDASDWSVGPDEINKPEEVLQQITLDNAKLRESNQIQEKTFDVELGEPLFEMRKDTTLVLVDIPGINEAGSSDKYKTYVTDKWDTYDAAIVVMDAKQGVNTDDQVGLLQFVKTNNSKKKDIPVIILCNKVDEPDEPEQAHLVTETRKEVERIFEVSCRKQALKLALKGKGRDCFPIFMPISAIHAYIYQTVSLMDFNKFQSFDKDLINRMGRELVGVKWKRLSAKKRLTALFEVVSDPGVLKEVVAETNFDEFLRALAFCVGGKINQGLLIRKQVNIALGQLSTAQLIGQQIEALHAKLTATNHDQPAAYLKDSFWTTYSTGREGAIEEFKANPMKVSRLGHSMKQLVSYYVSAKRLGWLDELPKILDASKKLVKQQFGVIFGKEIKASQKLKGATKSTALLASWEDLLANDWICIFDSILFVPFTKDVWSDFGQEKIYLERLRSVVCVETIDIDGFKCPKCKVAVSKQHSPPYEYYRCPSNHYSMDTDVVAGKICPCCQYPSYKLDANGCCTSSCRRTVQPLPKRRVITPRMKYIDGCLKPVDQEEFSKVQKLVAPASLEDPNHFGHLISQSFDLVAKSSL